MALIDKEVVTTQINLPLIQAQQLQALQLLQLTPQQAQAEQVLTFLRIMLFATL
jgi:hypothetical protein